MQYSSPWGCKKILPSFVNRDKGDAAWMQLIESPWNFSDVPFKAYFTMRTRVKAIHFLRWVGTAVGYMTTSTTSYVTARHASLPRKRRLVYMETYILFILAISALISGLYHLSFGVYGFHLQDVVPIRPEVEGRLCLCLYGVHVHD